MIDNPHVAGPGIFEILLYLVWDIGHAWQRWMTPYVGMTDDSRRWSNLSGKMIMWVSMGIAPHARTCTHKHTYTVLLQGIFSSIWHSNYSTHWFQWWMKSQPGIHTLLSFGFFLISHSLFFHPLSSCAMISSWPHRVRSLRCISKMRW